MSVLERGASPGTGMGWAGRARWALAVGFGVSGGFNLVDVYDSWRQGPRYFLADLVALAVLILAGTALTRSTRRASWWASLRLALGLAVASAVGVLAYRPSLWLQDPPAGPIVVTGIVVAALLFTGGLGVFPGMAPPSWWRSVLTAVAVAAATAVTVDVTSVVVGAVGHYDSATDWWVLLKVMAVTALVLLAGAAGARWHLRNVLALLTAGFGVSILDGLLLSVLVDRRHWPLKPLALDLAQALLTLGVAAVAIRPVAAPAPTPAEPADLQ